MILSSKLFYLLALGYKQLLLMLYTTFLWLHGKLTWLVFPTELISYQPIRYWIFLPFRGSVYYVSHKQTILVSCNILQLPHQRELRFRSLNFTIKRIEINKSILLSFSLGFGGLPSPPRKFLSKLIRLSALS